MKCPRCQAKLDRIALLIGEACLCSQCEGIWFDDQNLEKFLKLGEDTLDSSDLYVSLQGQDHGISLDAPIDCPYCQKRMRRYEYASNTGIFLDACSSHGVWLDDGELGAILKSGKGASRNIPASFSRWLGGWFRGLGS